jgi:HemY protein
VSPVTGQLDAFQWRVPVENAEPRNQEAILGKLEELVALGARTEKTPAEPAISLPPRSSQKAAQPPRNAEDADVVEVTKPAAVQPAASVPEAARTAPAEPVKPSTPSSAPIPIKPRTAATAEPAKPASAPAPTMADGVLRTVRATNPPPSNSQLRSAPNIYVAPHAPDDPGLDDQGTLPASNEHTRPYAVPYTRPAKQRT